MKEKSLSIFENIDVRYIFLLIESFIILICVIFASKDFAQAGEKARELQEQKESAKYSVSVITGRFHNNYFTDSYFIEDGIITFTSIPDGQVIHATSFYIIERSTE